MKMKMKKKLRINQNESDLLLHRKKINTDANATEKSIFSIKTPKNSEERKEREKRKNVICFAGDFGKRPKKI